MSYTTTILSHFSYDIEDIKKYIYAAGVFTLLLHTGEIVHYEPESIRDFEYWLSRNGIKDIRLE